MTKEVKPPKESAVQATILKCIRLTGLKAYSSSAFRQKESSGVSKGLPDIFVVHDTFHLFIGIEVKRPGAVRWSSPEQKEAYLASEFILAQSPEDALRGLLPHFPLDSAKDTHQRIQRVLRSLENGS